MLILFDIDDTLIDHSSAMMAAATELWRNIGVAMPLEEFLADWTRFHERQYPRYLQGELTYQGQRRARIRETVDPLVNDVAADEAFDVYFTCYRESWSLFADARSCLESLSRHQLGVISNGRSEEQRLKLARTGILELFQYILISEECGTPKPSPQIFVHACAIAGEAPENAFYVGDRYDVDAEASRRAGLRGIWLDRHGRKNSTTLPPLIGSLEELPALIDSMV